MKLENIKSNMKPTIVLGVICLVSALLLALVNVITGPIIAANQNAAANEALLEVLPDGKNFKEIELGDKYPKAITKGYKADGGYVFQATVTGKSSGLVIMCGINSDGKVVGTKVIAEQETDSYDVKVFPYVEGLDGEYKDQTLEGFTPYLVSGATLTSAAYSEAIKASLQAAAIAGGGDVDTRTPEQILQDSCNEALGTSGKSFKRWFATEILVGIDKTYAAKDGSGYFDCSDDDLQKMLSPFFPELTIQ
jgi:Na+-translocating ferredoxin:NAD+ oxidoreductase RnfG subunit